MGYRRSMFPKSSSRLGMNILSGMIIGGTAATAYGMKKVADKMGEAAKDPKNQQLAEENVGIGFKIFMYTFLLVWIWFGLWLGSVTFDFIAMIIDFLPLFLLVECIKEDLFHKKKKKDIPKKAQ